MGRPSPAAGLHSTRRPEGLVARPAPLDSRCPTQAADRPAAPSTAVRNRGRRIKSVGVRAGDRGCGEHPEVVSGLRQPVWESPTGTGRDQVPPQSLGQRLAHGRCRPSLVRKGEKALSSGPSIRLFSWVGLVRGRGTPNGVPGALA